MNSEVAPLDHASSPPSIVLTGFMGTGKSTIGRVLARQLRFDFIDTDREIERVHGPIPQLFEELGETGFRQIERELAAELHGVNRTVIATGGGMLLDRANVETLGATATIFCLVATVEDILTRITRAATHHHRPLLDAEDPLGRIRELLAERSATYAQFIQVNTAGMSPDEVAGLIAIKAATVAQEAR